jgi:hypothetical protein
VFIVVDERHLLHKKLFQQCKNTRTLFFYSYDNIQGVSEIGALILTGNRTRQKEQLFYLPFCRKTMSNSKKKNWRDFSLK